MRTLTLITLLFLAACDESKPRNDAPTQAPSELYIRSGACVSIEQVGPLAVKVAATGLPHVVIEIHYWGGGGEVWAMPQDGVLALKPAPQWAEVYPAFVTDFPGYPVTLKENGNGSLLTTTAPPTHSGRILIWNGGANGSWMVK